MMNQSKRLLIDNRTSEDILEDIKKKAKFYTPEWNIDEENPDIGYAIAKIFSKNMEENIDSLNQILDNYHTEFVNMLDISPKSARPAEGLVEFSIGIDTIGGTYIPKGTKLRTDGEESLIYETQNGLYVTSSNIVNMFMVDGEDGLIRPLKGRFKKPSLLPDLNNSDDEGEEEDGVLYTPGEFRLFGEDESISQNSVFFYHGSVINTGNNPVLIRIEGNQKIIDSILSGEYVFKWFSESGLLEFESTKLLEDGVTFSLVRGGEEKVGSLMLGGKSYYVIVLESNVPVRENLSVERVSFSSKGEELPLDFATDGNSDFDIDEFGPFGEALAPYEQCYIGMENYFSKIGSNVEISFDVVYKDHLYDVMGTSFDDSTDLRIIKKKPKLRTIDLPADCVANEISIEYFNGTGWKKLITNQHVANMFAKPNAGKYVISFKVPEDWVANESGAYTGRMLKLQILQADNSYHRPCIHHYPVIKNCKVSYSYEDKFIIPSKLRTIAGTSVYDLTRSVYEDRKYNLFGSTEYFNDALYMGFSRPLDNGPISIMFEIEENFNAKDLKYTVEYSSANGFKQMKVIDSTGGMTRTGTISFLPQPDMAKTTLEGKYLYWIRILRTKSEIGENRKLLPMVKDIKLNVVRVANIDRLEERDIYIDSVQIDQKIVLHEKDILDIDLWVNELGVISQYELEKLKNEYPEDCKIEYDSAGNMTSCFIRYEECNSFSLAEQKRVYILDRINGEVLFGDGIRTFTPRVLDDIAVKYTIRKSQGSQGNADAGAVRASVGNLLYIEEVNNPLKIFNGSDMEDIDNVLKRGSLLLQARNRLLSKEDFKREIVLYTDAVKDIEIICEKQKNGNTDPLSVSCVLLLNDFMLGKGAFNQIATGVKKHLLDSCEITINSDNLHIVDPIFVDISVDIWAESINIDESFELQNILKDDLEKYLSPVSGWKIGTLPKASQILMRLNVLKSKAVIKKSIIIAKYTDQDGDHEMDIKNVKVNPFMICRSGQHNVHVILSN